MPVNVGGIEAFLDAKIAPFLRSMDAGEKRMDQVEKKVTNLDKKMADIGKRLALVGAGITAAFGLGIAAADHEARSIARLRAQVISAGGDFDEMESRVMATVRGLEELTTIGTEELEPLFGRLFQATSNEALSLKILSLSARLAAQGLGNVEGISESLMAAMSGQPSLLLRLDRSLNIVKDRWAAQAKTMGAARAEAGFTAEAFEILERKASITPELTPLQRVRYQLGELNKDIGIIVTTVAGPVVNVLAGGVRAARAFADTGLGRIVTIGTFVAGIFATVTGGALLFTAQIIKGIGALKGFFVAGSATAHVLKVIGVGFLKTIAVAAALEAGLQLANLLNQWEGFRVVVQRLFAALAFGAEKVKGFFGKGNQEMAQAYWDIASGKVAVGEEAPQRLSIVGLIADKVRELAAATNAATVAGGQEVDILALLEQQLNAVTGAVEKKTKAEAEDHTAANMQALAEAQQTLEARRLRKQALEEELMLQRGLHEEVLAIREAERTHLLAAIEERRAAIGEASVEDLERLVELNEEIARLTDEQTERLKSPWQEAGEGIVGYGEFAQGVMSSVQGLASGLADTIVNGIAGGAKMAKQSFGDFFGSFMKQIAAMILRALVLSAILSILPGAGTFGGTFKSFMGIAAKPGAGGGITGAAVLGPKDEAANDARLRLEGSRMVDLLLGGMGSRLGTLAVAGAGVSSGEISGRGVGSRDQVVEVNEATPMTWVRIYDRHLQSRAREREDRQTERT